ncbi:AhpD-like protein [Xylariomycetidae sp. FL0641]|nr:AhpD-like protein [Xylariomycetidae sp. FL0641]
MRIPYAEAPFGADPETPAIVARVAARRAPRPLQALDRALLHAPPVADGWNAFLGAVRTRTSLGAREREVAICRVAVANRAWYEWGHHAPLARQAGLGEAGVEMLRREGLSDVTPEEREAAKADGLGDREWAVLKFADESTRNVQVSDETFAALRAVCSEREVVEVTATVAAYNCVSRFLVALDVGERNSTGPDDVAH